MTKFSVLVCSAAVAALSAVVNPAQAEGDPAPQSTDSDSQLADIVVTARRQNESILKVPVAASALSTADLARAGTPDIQSLSGAIPSLKIDNSGGGGGSFSIRGIGSSVIDGGSEQSVVTVLDGIQTSRGIFIQLGLLDLAQVEVLKGPQVLFFGKNSPGGVISLTSQGPTDKLSVNAKAGYEFNAHERYVESAISSPLSDTVSVRLAGRYDAYDGWNKNVAVSLPNPFAGIPGNSATIGGATFPANDASDALGRLTVAYKPTTDFSATLRVLGSSQNDRGPSSTAETVCPGAHPDLLGIPDPSGDCKVNGRYASGAIPPQLVSSPLFQSKPYEHFNASLTSLTMDYGSGPVRLTSVTGYLAYRWKYFQVYPTTYGYPFAGNLDKFHQLSQEFRVVTNYDSPLNFAGGLYYESISFSQYAPNAIFPDAADPATGNFRDVDYNGVSSGQNYSAFGQARWKLLQQLELSAGVRYSHDVRNNKLFYSFVNANSPLKMFGIILPEGVVESGKASFDNYSPEVTLSWEPARDALLYGSYRTGYKAGAATSPGLIANSFNSATDLFYKPERISGFEVGAKTLQANDRLRLTAAVYSYKYTDLQIANFNSVSFSVQPLAGNLRTRGFEAEAAFKVISGLTLNAGVGYSRSRYTKFPGVACYPGQTAPQGCVGGSQDLTGQSRFRSPDWTGNAGFDYEAPVFNDLVLGVDGSMNFSSKYFTQENNAPFAVQTSYQIFNAGVRLRSQDSRYQVAMIGRNLGDKRYIASSFDLPDSNVPGTINAIVTRPREATLEFTVRY